MNRFLEKSARIACILGAASGALCGVHFYNTAILYRKGDGKPIYSRDMNLPYRMASFPLIVGAGATIGGFVPFAPLIYICVESAGQSIEKINRD